MVHSLYTGLVLAILAAAAGCQHEPPFRFAPVQGTVTWGGKPLTGVIVVFWADPATGTPEPCSSESTDAAGRYELHTEQGETGAIVGRHRVCIVDSRVVQGRLLGGKANRNRLPDGLPRPAASLVPPKYADRKQTPLRAVVQPEAQVIDFEVK
jgi:hypothetical protein